MKIHISQFLYRVVKTSTLYTCIVIANCPANNEFCNVRNQVREGVNLFKDKIQNSQYHLKGIMS